MTDTDVEDLREIREQIDELQATAARLQELGEEHDIPAVERNASRVGDVAGMLELNVPEELFEVRE